MILCLRFDVSQWFPPTILNVQTSVPKSEVSRMDWSERLNGGLAKTEHGFFSYERGAARYGEGNGMPLTLHGFLTLDAAKATAEKYAKSLDVSEVVQSRKFGQVGNLQPLARQLSG
jgi:hypothetical protein